MRNKQLLLAICILLSAGIFTFLNYWIISSSFRENPIVICNGGALSDSCLIKSAVDMGAKKGTFIQCFQGQKYISQIQDDQQLATEQGINSGPTLLAGITDNGQFVGFNTNVTTYAELSTIISDINDEGLAKAQQTRAVIIKQQVESNLKEYLKSSGLDGAKLDQAYLDNQPDVDVYMQAYELKRFDAKEQNVIGNGNVTLVYFSDFGSTTTYDFAQGVLASLSANDFVAGGARMVVKDLAVANEVMDSTKLANAVRCAGEQGKYQAYFEYINSLQQSN